MTSRVRQSLESRVASSLRSVEFEGRKYREVTRQSDLADGTWWWDEAARNLHVRVKVKAGEDCIINVL